MPRALNRPPPADTFSDCRRRVCRGRSVPAILPVHGLCGRRAGPAPAASSRQLVKWCFLWPEMAQEAVGEARQVGRWPAPAAHRATGLPGPSQRGCRLWSHAVLSMRCAEPRMPERGRAVAARVAIRCFGTRSVAGAARPEQPPDFRSLSLRRPAMGGCRNPLPER